MIATSPAPPSHITTRPSSVLAALDRPLAPRLGRLSGVDLRRATDLTATAISQLEPMLLRNVTVEAATRFLDGAPHADRPADMERIERSLGLFGDGPDAGKTAYAALVFTDRPWRPTGVDEAARGAAYGPVTLKLKRDVIERATFTPLDSYSVVPFGQPHSLQDDVDWPAPVERLERPAVAYLERLASKRGNWPAVDWDAKDESVIAAVQRRLTSNLTSANYIEAQVHCGVGIDDVAEIRVLEGTPGAQQVMDQAARVGIPCRVIPDIGPFDGWPTPTAKAREWRA